MCQIFIWISKKNPWFWFPYSGFHARIPRELEKEKNFEAQYACNWHLEDQVPKASIGRGEYFYTPGLPLTKKLFFAIPLLLYKAKKDEKVMKILIRGMKKMWRGGGREDLHTFTPVKIMVSLLVGSCTHFARF